MTPSRTTPKRLWLRACMPSTASIIWSVGTSVVVVVGHILVLSIQAGTLWPGLLDGYFATFYTNYVVQPVLWIANQQATNIAASVAIWAVGASVAYTVVEGLIRTAITVRKEERDIEVINNMLVRHPFWRQFLFKIGWRLVVGASFVLMLELARPFFNLVFRSDRAIFAGTSLVHTLGNLLLALGGGLVIGHTTTVLLRLYLFRVRVFS